VTVTTGTIAVTAVVVTLDDEDDVSACLAALDAQDHPALDVVVLDNASSDGTVAAVERHLAGSLRHPVRLIREERNVGLCAAVNRVLAGPTGDAVLLVNADAVLDASCVRLLVDVLVTHPDCGSVQPRLLRPADGGPDRIDTTGHVRTRPRLVLNRGEGEPADAHAPAAGEVFGVSGAAVLHRRAMLDDVARRVGGGVEWLTEDLVAYFDDVELDLRARMRGWTARYAPEATGRHARAGASLRRPRRVHALNVANHLLVTIGMEPARTLVRDAAVILPVWAARLVVGLLRRPTAAPLVLWRLRLLPRAVRRGMADRARASVDVVRTLDAWTEPLPPGWFASAMRRGATPRRRPPSDARRSYSVKNAK
jgi:GT2 family glycosyltransferase